MSSKKNNPFKALQREVERWIDIRKKTTSSCQELVNLINRLTFMTNDKVHSAFGDALMPSRLSAGLRDEISDKSDRLHSLQDDMMQCLKQISVLKLSVFPDASVISNDTMNTIIAPSSSSCLIEHQAFANILNQMQQQTLLEMCIVEELCGRSDSDDDDEVDDCDDEEEHYDHSLSNTNDKTIDKSETCGKNSLRNRGEGRNVINGDNDVAVTMLACFTYPPYLHISELESFIDLK